MQKINLVVEKNKEDKIEDEKYTSDLDDLTPRQIVQELDRYIIGQDKAKKAVAIALRNRWRRQRVRGELREEILPNNIIMIGPTGVGKTEISRRLAKLANAPFIKVEASKYTEVGYVGRDVESMIRDLVELGVNMVRQEREDEVADKADDLVEDRLLDLLVPPLPKPSPEKRKKIQVSGQYLNSEKGSDVESTALHTEKENIVPITVEERRAEAQQKRERTREKMRKRLREGKLENRNVEIEATVKNMPFIEVFSPAGLEEMDINISEMFGEILPKKKKKRMVTIAEARRVLFQEEVQKLIDIEDVISEAIERVENSGIVFLDEIDKIAGEAVKGGPDVSREGVQRDLLPIVEGSKVPTKYGLVRTDHVLFIAAGAFHVSKPADLIPEMQGRFPIRVELASLTEKDLERILTEPENALIRQYIALLETEGVHLKVTKGAIKEIAKIAAQVNGRMENIGARRLHTILTTLLEDILFNVPDTKQSKFPIDEKEVRKRLEDIVKDEDLRKYIL